MYILRRHERLPHGSGKELSCCNNVHQIYAWGNIILKPTPQQVRQNARGLITNKYRITIKQGRLRMQHDPKDRTWYLPSHMKKIKI